MGGNWRGWAQLGGILAVVVVAVLLARLPSEPAWEVESAPDRGAAHVPVDVVQPERAPHSVSVRLNGSVLAEGAVSLAFPVNGRVAAVSTALRTGGSFSAGEVLLKLDDRLLALTVDAAEAEARAAAAKLEKKQAQGAAGRAEYLRSNPGSTVPPLVEKTPQIKRAQALLDRAEARAASARLLLEQNKLSVPFDGRLAIPSPIAVGDLIRQGQVVGSAFRVDALRITATIPTEDVERLSPIIGREATVNLGPSTLRARVTALSATVNAVTRAAIVTLHFAEEAALATMPPPGAFAQVEIRGDTRDDVYLLPARAEHDGGTAWVVADGTLRAIRPQTLDRTREGWLVEAFDPADGVVLGPLQSAREGLTVVPTATAAP